MPDRWLTFHDAARAVFEESPTATKEQLAQRLARRFAMTLDRSVFDAGDFAVRFAHTSVDAFSGSVVSLAKIRKYDDRPFLVCVTRPRGVETLLANSTFIDKVSHSSRALSLTNIRGTILGRDILKSLDGVENSPPNFEDLFARHEGLTWEENLERIVERTTGILPRGARYAPTTAEQERILQSVQRAAAVVAAGEIEHEARRLSAIAEERRDEILEAATRANVNVRGNAIERLITGGVNQHGLGDLTIHLPGGTRLMVDIKSKLRGRASSPKLYSVDKLLRELSDGCTVFAALFVLVDPEERRVTSRLVNVLDDALRHATRAQHHWAGRASRGVTQLIGGADVIFEPGFQEHIDLDAAEQFVRALIDR